jgi:3-methyladenine DNA glycosylase AlkD
MKSLKPLELVSEIQTYCSQNANPAGAAKWARYFAEGYDAWGLLDKGHPIFTTQCDAWLAKYASLGVEGFCKAGETLFQSGKFEEGSLSIQFLKSRLAEVDASHLPLIAKWFPNGVRNWAHTDVLCGEILSPLLTAGTIELQDLLPWRDSPHRFQRRAFPVALLACLKPPKRIPALLKLVGPLMADTEKVVHQGMGWFLREAWKLSPEPVEAFLLKHKDTSPRLIIATATEKMTADGKVRFKKARRA